MAASLPALPGSLKSVQHYLKTAVEHDKRDPVVSYYCRLYTAQKAMEIDRKSPEAKAFLVALMDVLEKTKGDLGSEEAIKSEIVGQAHLESYALKLFLYADNEDRAARFGKNVVKSFYTAGMLFDVLTQFGELSEDIEKNQKYAKWKAAYIHNCLKNGETPISGPLDDEEGEEGSGGGAIGFESQQPGPSGGYPPAHQPPPPAQPPHHYPQQPGGGAGAGYPPSNLQPGPSQPAYVQPNLPSPQAQPHAPPTTPSDAAGTRWQPPANPAGVSLQAQDYQKAMKLCKYASSALQYEDSKTAIDNLTKALNLLTSGKE